MGRELGHTWSLEGVENACDKPDPGVGMSLEDLCTAGKKLGVDLVPVECEFDALRRMTPAILFLSQGSHGCPHFVVAAETARGSVRIVDPPRTDRWLSQSDLARQGWRYAVVPERRLEASQHRTNHRVSEFAVLATLMVMTGIYWLHRTRKAGIAYQVH
jgi:ABC-type bacteriocin/lantibiotic exporter with double-glycine peptidase domain